jgi:hypothetical protein
MHRAAFSGPEIIHFAPIKERQKVVKNPAAAFLDIVKLV